MTRAWLLTSTLAAPLVLCLAGCPLLNPEFDPNAGGAETGEGAEAPSETSTTQTSSNDDPTGDGDGDGDSETTLDTGMEAPDRLDLPPDSCIPTVTEGLMPRYGSPAKFQGASCPTEVGRFVKVFATEGGDWMVTECEPYCTFCDEQIELVVGAQYLSLAMLLPLVNDPNQPWLDCHYIEANPLVLTEDTGCYYGSLSIHTDEGPGSPLQFNANRESWGLTASAVQKIGEWHPMVVDQADVAQCLCEDTDIDCCPGQTVIAKKFLVPDAVYPGQQAPIQLGNGLWHMFFGAQAQSGTTCDLDPETSWAILAEG